MSTLDRLHLPHFGPREPRRRWGPLQLSFFCELGAAELERLFADEELIRLLRRLRATVTLGLVDLGGRRAAVVRRLNEAGIPTAAWLLLPEEGGYWCNAHNAGEAWERYGDFVAWTRAHRLRWERVGIDIEPNIDEVRAVRRNPIAILRALPRIFRCIAQNREMYQGLVRRIHADGYPVDAYVFPFIHTEREAGTEVLQRITGMIDLTVDREIVMLYTSFARPHGHGFLDFYARHFPAVAVGVTGGGVEEGLDPPPPLSWDELARDLRLARRHTDDIHVFSLEGCVEQGFLERLVDFDWGVPVESAAATERAAALTRRMRLALRALDRPHVTSLAALAAVAVPLGLLALAGRTRRNAGDGGSTDDPLHSEPPSHFDSPP
ncbi:MAG TPA: hypothetical protein VE871_02140 [Longimicrobium sp.]|nr:hypothetical protein [Longimicrobium sp.]